MHRDPRVPHTDTIASRDTPSSARAWVVLGILLTVGIISYLDRYLISLLVGPIRHDLKITDTQISLLQGMAFAVFYVAMGLPFGALVDRSNRRNILAIAIALWSVMTFACGLAHNFTELFIARMGVGIGEACLGPAAYSLIADYFSPRARGRAMSVYNMSNYAGTGASLLLGALVLHRFGTVPGLDLPLFGWTATWKIVFLIASVPGLVAAAVVMLVVREVPRRESAAVTSNVRIFDYLHENAYCYAFAYAAFVLAAFIALTCAAWGPSMMIRRFDYKPTEAGLLMGVTSIVGGILGALVSGIAGDYLVAGEKYAGRFRLLLLSWPVVVVGLCGWCMSYSSAVSLMFMGTMLFGCSLGVVAGPPSFQDVTPNRLRGRVQALYFILSGLLGMGVAPTLVALVTDHVFHDDRALGKSLLVVLIPVALVGFTASLLGQSPYQRRYLRMKAELKRV